MTRYYLKPEYLSRIPIEGLDSEELRDVIGQVAAAIHHLTQSVEIGIDVVDLVIRDVLEQHRRDRDTATGPGAVAEAAAQANPEAEVEANCTCEGGDIGLPHTTDCPLYPTAQYVEPEASARVLVLRPEGRGADPTQDE